MNIDSIHSFRLFVSFVRWRETQALLSVSEGERIKHIFTKSMNHFVERENMLEGSQKYLATK
jgi:hypothetical protein